MRSFFIFFVFSFSVSLSFSEERGKGNTVRQITQRDIDARRNASFLMEGITSREAPQKAPSIAVADYMENMQVLALGNAWTAIPMPAILYVPEGFSKYYSSELDQLARKSSPTFVTQFPGSFFRIFRHVEVTRSETGYTIPYEKLEDLKKVNDGFVIAVEKGKPVRMPVVVLPPVKPR